MIPETTIVRDSNGNVILERRSDGFEEINSYNNNKLIRQETRYPNGIIEVCHFAEGE